MRNTISMSLWYMLTFLDWKHLSFHPHASAPSSGIPSTEVRLTQDSIFYIVWTIYIFIEEAEYGNFSPGTNNIGHSFISFVHVDWLQYQDNFLSSQIIFRQFVFLLVLLIFFKPWRFRQYKCLRCVQLSLPAMYVACCDVKCAFLCLLCSWLRYSLPLVCRDVLYYVFSDICTMYLVPVVFCACNMLCVHFLYCVVM